MRLGDVVEIFKLEHDKDPSIWDLPSEDMCMVPHCLSKDFPPFLFFLSFILCFPFSYRAGIRLRAPPCLHSTVSNTFIHKIPVQCQPLITQP